MMKWCWAVLLLTSACGSGGATATYSDKCRLACNPSAVTACASMDPSACQHDCEALTAGLSGTCATCLTQGNAWGFALDNRQSGMSGCHGYAFPSLTDTSSMGCANFCK
jgi:hypothetical protein